MADRSPISTRLKSERERLGLTQQALSESVGVRREQWTRYEAGTEPGAEILARIATSGIDVMYVLTGHRGSVGTEVGASTGTKVAEAEPIFGAVLKHLEGDRSMSFVLVPRYSIKASAGHGRDNGEFLQQAVGEIAFEAEWMRRCFGRAGMGFALLDVAGSSMEPTLWDGETILVDLQSRELSSGSVYVLRDGDELLVKRLQRLIGGGVEVMSDNPSFRSQVLEPSSELQIVGRVVWPKVR